MFPNMIRKIPKVVHNINLQEDSDLDQLPFKEIVNKFELDPNTVDLIGHTLAFETNDLYLEKPAIETIKKI